MIKIHASGERMKLLNGGGYSIIDEYDDENQAFDEFYIMVKWEADGIAKIKEDMRKVRLQGE